MLVYANEAAEAPVESEIDSEYDTLVQQNTEIIQQNQAIIEGLDRIETCIGYILVALIISIAWRFASHIVNSLFGSA